MGCGPERATIKKLTDYLDTISGNEAASEQLTKACTEGTAKDYLAGQGVELTEEELHGVAAGATSFREYTSVVRDGTNVTANYVDYEWRGTDENQKYLCPNCQRPVHYGTAWRYYCDSCNESWFFESLLKLNKAGGWVPIANGVERGQVEGFRK